MVFSVMVGIMFILGGSCLLSWLMGVELMMLIFLIMLGNYWGGLVEGGYLFFMGLIVSVVMVSVVLSIYVQGLRLSNGCHLVV
uniref:NADH dehydrogenase subunit 4L n=1 Tax=Brentisentis yangtzensis TaxID=2604967 RepID=A0A5B9RKF4_9BILA|nr:NADH dehydrogenase subunit 4L [Brentisentis yangtzensis]